ASDNLKLCREAGWQTPSNHPDLVPAQEALLLKEGFRETVRSLAEDNSYGEQFAEWMREAEVAATALEDSLKSGDTQGAGERFAAIQDQCNRCHVEYRN